MTYNPNIPQPTDLISASQAQLLANFGQLNTQFGVDHIAFNTGSGNGDGTHKQVTFDAPVAAPTATGTVSILYPINATNSYSNKPIPFWANAAGNFPILPDIKNVNSAPVNGFGFKIGNVIVNFGVITFTGAAAVTVTFVVPFTNTNYALDVTNAANQPTIYGTKMNTTVIITGSGTTEVSFIAIGT